MSADVESRKLHELRVTDLRNELGKRNLDSKGVKNELVDRLAKALESEEHDPEEYLFDVESSDKKNPRSSKRRTLGEGECDKEDGTINDSSSNVEDELKDSSDVSEIKQEAIDAVEEDADGKENGHASDGVSADEVQESVKTKPAEKSEVEKPAAETAQVAEVKEEPREEMSNKNDTPKEQRINTPKKSVTEESKEKPEDTEDSINLTIGEDEVKLFGEEEEPTHEKDGKENRSESSNAAESAKTNLSNTEENKQDGKSNVKKTTSKVEGSSRNLWVSGLSSMTRATDLKSLFSKYGKVVAAKIVTNAKTPGSRCYGYVTMQNADDATVSMQNLHKTELNGRMILVERAKDDGTGPARPKIAKKEADKKKIVESKDEKKSIEEKKKIVKTENETKQEDKKVKEEKKDTNEVVNGESKTGSVKSENIRSDRARSHRSSKSKDRVPHRPRDPERPRSGVLTFAQIKEERERNRMRERERALRIEEKRRQIERERQRDIERRQREEGSRLERERLKLKMEREKIEREKAELLKLEREAQRQERERLQREKEELRRQQMKLEETRRAVKRPLEITRTFDDDRKRRPPSPDRRHVHVSSSSTSRKEPPVSRSNGTRRGSPSDYASSRRTYESTIEITRKEPSSHSSRDKSGKESSRYDHHNYQSSHGSDDVRSKDVRHRYPDPSSKSSSKTTQSSRYDRSVDNWARPSSSNVGSSVKQFSNMGTGSGGNSSMSSRDAWGGDRKSDAPHPWNRNTASASERWTGSSTSASGMNMSRSGPINSSNSMFSSSGNYSDTMSGMNMIGLSSGPPAYTDRFDAYKSSMRKY